MMILLFIVLWIIMLAVTTGVVVMLIIQADQEMRYLDKTRDAGDSDDT